MAKFNIKIIKDNGDIDIYTNPYNIVINNDTVIVDYEDKNVNHDTDQIDEIVIKPNH